MPYFSHRLQWNNKKLKKLMFWNFFKNFLKKVSLIFSIKFRYLIQWNYEFVTANRTFCLFLCFFCKKFGSVRSNRTSYLTEYDAFKWWRYWIMFNWLITKKYKNNRKISRTVRRDKIELVRLSSVRFKNLFKFDSFNVLRSKIFSWIKTFKKMKLKKKNI